MDGSMIDLSRPQVREALGRLARGLNIITISCLTSLPVEVISFFQVRQIALHFAARADLSRFIPSFRFDSSYIDLQPGSENGEVEQSD
jgi:hypothetical protein